MSIIRRRRRCLPIDSDSSEDDHFDNRRLRSSSTSSTQAISMTNNRKKGGRLPIVTSDEEDEESSGEVIQYIQVNHRCNNYNATSSSDERRRLVLGLIQTRSGKRILKPVDYSLVNSSDSDSAAPIGFQMKKKRMKFCSSSSESSLEDEHSGGVERAVRLNSSARPDKRERPNTSRNSMLSSRTTRNRVAANQRIWNRIESDGSESEATSDDDIRPRVLRHHSDRVAANQIKWRRIETDDSESEATSEDDIRPRVLQHHSKTVLFSNTSSSDSDDEVPIRRLKKRSSTTTIIYSDDDNSCLQKIPDEDPEVCPICLSDFNLQEVGKPSACDHSFCLGCIKEWANNNNTCPVDRQQFVSILVLSSIHGEPVKEIPVFNVQRMITGWEAEEVEVTFQNYSSSDDQEEVNEVCCHCMRNSGDDSMICCDACYNIYHLHCVDPPLRSYPAGPWICTRCENN